MKGPAGPFWNNLNGVKQLECHNPEFKYAGEVYLRREHVAATAYLPEYQGIFHELVAI